MNKVKLIKNVKPKIYMLLTSVSLLTPTAGDKINEIALIKTMSQFADIYYNDQLVNLDKTDLGLVHKTIVKPTRKYDLYYIRNNLKMFKKLPHPKIWIGSPYDKYAFENADAIGVLTKSWKTLFENYNEDKGLYGLIKGNISLPKNIVVFEQSCESEFKPGLYHNPITQKIRNDLTDNQPNSFLIGHFGRVSNSCYPFSLIHILPKLKQKYPNVKVVFCGLKSHIKSALNTKHIDLKEGYDRKLMPYAISACDMVVCNHRTDEGHFCGSRRILEAMACGIPILCGNFMARKEQLGNNYPLMWEYNENSGRLGDIAETQIIDTIGKLIDDPKYRSDIGKYLINRSQHYTIENTAKRIHQNLIDQKLL